MELTGLTKKNVVTAVAALTLAVCAWAGAVQADNGGHEHGSHHHQMASSAVWVKSTAEYKLPAVTLVRSDGVNISLPQEVDDGRPVILNFIYTGCTTVCPVMTRTFAEVQELLGAERDRVRMISISIDPEQDTPSRLREYAKRYNAGEQWKLYTGTLEASVAAQKAFNAYRGDKMNHQPVTFIRSSPGQPWVRLEGFASPDDIVREYRMLVRGK